MDKSPAVEDALAAIDRLIFEPSAEPIVVALTGGWGSGKTYFWKNRVLTAHPGAKPKPGYISVFGAESLAVIRERLVISTSDFPKKGWLEKIRGSVTTWVRNAINYWGGKLLVSDSIAVEVLQSIVLKKGWVVCIDDVERLSESVGFENFLGYVSELRDLWQLRVVLIFNREPLDEKPSSAFHRYEEKVIDRVIPFALDYATICSLEFKEVRIAGVDVMPDLQAKSAVLGLRNIRLLAKVRSYFDDVALVLGPSARPEFLRAALASLLLFTYTRFSNQKPENLTFEMLADFSEWADRLRKTAALDLDKDEDEKGRKDDAKELLKRFGYSVTDDMDRVLMDFVQTDVLDSETLRSVHAAMIEEVSKSELNARMQGVWDTYYHGTLRSNSAELCDAVEPALKPFLQYIPPGELDFALQVLDESGRADKAMQFFEEFKRVRGHVFENLTRDSMPHGSFEYGPLKDYFAKIRKRDANDKRSLVEVMATAFDDRFVSSHDAARIAAYSVDDLVTYFMTHDQPHLTTKIRMLTKDGNDAVRAMAWEAAEKIAATDPLNHMRMKGMGLLRDTAGQPVDPSESADGG